MPIYEYVCSKCFNKFEVYASLSEMEKGLKPKCPACYSDETVKVFSSFAFIGDSRGSPNPPAGCGPTAGPGCCG